MLRKLLVSCLLTLVAAGSLSAQRANTRQGFWVGAGLGLGSTGADCTDCDNERTSGMSGYLRLGGTISRSLLVGVESNGWVHSESGIDETMGFGSVVAIWYPSATGGFFLKLGLGAMSYKADDGADELTVTAPSGSFGLGYEFRVGKNMSITPFLNSLATSNSDIKVNGETLASNADFKVNLVQVGVGLTWH